MSRVLIVVAGGPARTVVKYLVPAAEVVVAGAEVSGRYDRVLIHEAALLAKKADEARMQAWFDAVAATLPIGGSIYRLATLSGIVSEALAREEVVS